MDIVEVVDDEAFTLVDKDIQVSEGYRRDMYVDSTGHRSIGYGFNIDAGMSPRVALACQRAAREDAAADLDRQVPWWRDLPLEARRGLLEMAYNLGWPRLSGFKMTLLALREGRYDDAAQAAVASTWAVQVGQRAHTIAARFRSCQPVG